MIAFIVGSAELAAGIAATAFLILAGYGSIEWNVNGLPRRRDRVAILIVDVVLIGSAWIVAAMSIGTHR